MSVLVVTEENGEFHLISGHRRLKAIKLLIDEGRRKSTTVPCYIRSAKSADETQLDLIMLNATQRKISAYHKSLGDTVEWWLPNGDYDRVYSSKVFIFTTENPYLLADTIKGGTGYGLFSELPPEINDMFLDYSILG